MTLLVSVRTIKTFSCCSSDKQVFHSSALTPYNEINNNNNNNNNYLYSAYSYALSALQF